MVIVEDREVDSSAPEDLHQQRVKFPYRKRLVDDA